MSMGGRAAGIEMLQIKNVEKESVYAYKCELFPTEHIVGIDVEAGHYFPIKM